MAEPHQIFAAAATWFADVVEQIPPKAYERPGLGDWDVRALIGHGSRSLITVDSYLDQPATEVVAATATDYYLTIGALALDPAAIVERGRQAGTALGDRPAAAVTGLVERVLPRVRQAGNPVISTIVGGMPLRGYLPTRTFELVVHGLDLVRATGISVPEPPAAGLLEALDLAVQISAARGDGPTVLLALTGREPLRLGFSVV